MSRSQSRLFQGITERALLRSRTFKNAGITAINSEIMVKDCIIMPNLDIINYEGSYNPPLERYGRGIQIWNLYDNPNINPIIENNLILNTEMGIYLFPQAFSDPILGAINNNTLDSTTYGIVMRMHKENPMIANNIMTKL